MVWKLLASGIKNISSFIYELSALPIIFKNSLQTWAHYWFPFAIKPVCQNGDFICRGSNGLMKLENVVPGLVIKGLNVIADNPYKSIGVGGAMLLTAFYCHRQRHQQAVHAKRNPEKPLVLRRFDSRDRR